MEEKEEVVMEILRYIYYSACVDVLISILMHALAIIACIVLVVLLPIATTVDWIHTGKWANPYKPSGGEFPDKV